MELREKPKYVLGLSGGTQIGLDSMVFCDLMLFRGCYLGPGSATDWIELLQGTADVKYEIYPKLNNSTHKK